MKRILLIGAALAVVGCGGRDPVAEEAKNTDGLPTLNEVEASPTGAAPANAAAPAQAGPIPATLHGRWGLTPGDCTSDLGDAKGLLIVTPAQLQFYESRAVPASDAQTSLNSISGTFDFTGEGQEWSRYESLELAGSRMKRTERDPLTTFVYARCE